MVDASMGKGFFVCLDCGGKKTLSGASVEIDRCCLCYYDKYSPGFKDYWGSYENYRQSQEKFRAWLLEEAERLRIGFAPVPSWFKRYKKREETRVVGLVLAPRQ